MWDEVRFILNYNEHYFYFKLATIWNNWNQATIIYALNFADNIFELFYWRAQIFDMVCYW